MARPPSPLPIALRSSTTFVLRGRRGFLGDGGRRALSSRCGRGTAVRRSAVLAFSAQVGGRRRTALAGSTRFGGRRGKDAEAVAWLAGSRRLRRAPPARGRRGEAARVAFGGGPVGGAGSRPRRPSEQPAAPDPARAAARARPLCARGTDCARPMIVRACARARCSVLSRMSSVEHQLGRGAGVFCQHQPFAACSSWAADVAPRSPPSSGRGNQQAWGGGGGGATSARSAAPIAAKPPPFEQPVREVMAEADVDGAVALALRDAVRCGEDADLVPGSPRPPLAGCSGFGDRASSTLRTLGGRRGTMVFGGNAAQFVGVPGAGWQSVSVTWLRVVPVIASAIRASRCSPLAGLDAGPSHHRVLAGPGCPASSALRATR